MADERTAKREAAGAAVPPTGASGAYGASSDPAAAAIAAAKARAAAAAAQAAARATAAAQSAGQPSAAPLPPDLQSLADRIERALPHLERDPLTEGLPGYRVARERLLETCRTLRAGISPGLDYLTCVSGVDFPDHVDVVYHIFAIGRALGCVLKVSAAKPAGASANVEVAPAEMPWVPSVTGVWPGADWHEREIFDLFGVRFDGHPDLRRILMPEGFSGGYPLRKDYVDRREQRERKVRER